MAEPLKLVPERWQDSLLTHPVSKPVYVVAKIGAEELARYPNLVETGRKNGFLFFIKPATP